MRARMLALFGLALGLAGCTASTDTTEVGVRTIYLSPIGGRGVVEEPYAPGGTYFFFRPLSAWMVFDTAVQNHAMLRAGDEGARVGDDALRFKTVDGNDITVDVTIAWSIDGQHAAYVAQFVGQDTREVEEKLIRPVARTIVRDVLNALTSEEYYQADRRFEMAEEARRRLNVVLNQEGVVIDQVLLGEHHFNDTYDQMIKDKKVAEQEAERLVSETQAAVEEMKREMATAQGQVARSIAEAEGAARRKKLEGDALHYERVQQAAAIRAEKRAEADALIERARAVSGSGGRNMVKLKVADALKGKKIIFVPAGGGMDLRTTDVNELLEVYGAKSVAGK